MKIEGITIQIIAGPYVYPENDEDPAYVDPVFVENGEINIGDMNKVPVSEIKDMAKRMATRMMHNHIRECNHGNKRDCSGKH